MAGHGPRRYKTVFQCVKATAYITSFLGWSCIPQRSRSTFGNRIAVFLRYLQQFLLQAVGSFQIHAFFCVAARNQTPKVPQCPHTEIDDFNGKQGRGKDGVSDSNRFVDVHFLSLFFIVSSFGTGAPNTRVPRTLSAKCPSGFSRDHENIDASMAFKELPRPVYYALETEKHHADHRFPFPLVAERDLRGALQAQRVSSRRTQQPRRIQLCGTRGTPVAQFLDRVVRSRSAARTYGWPWP